jgi:mannose-6-phosphate isomerase
MPTPPPEPILLGPMRQALRAWLFDHALPLWWKTGADHEHGGFHETISQDGRPASPLRRSRVQSRQIFVYATAGRLGWQGPWREAVDHGLDFFLNHFQRPDGLTRAAVSNDGTPVHEEPVLYDQAFALFALASAHAAGVQDRDLPARSRDLLKCVLASSRHAGGGFREIGPGLPAWQSNAHMHLLEAVLAWAELDEDRCWNAVADEIAELAMARFIDADGRLREFFNDDWTPAQGLDGRLIEPGHQFEWAWLLYRWGALRQREDASRIAAKLVATGRTGRDPARNIVVQQMLEDGSVHDAVARVWPQTEWIKAAAISGRQPDADVSFWASETLQACAAMSRYLETPVPGLWRERSYPDGNWSSEPAPASSFYHIVCALDVLGI